MVDILDMEDIFTEILISRLINKTSARLIAIRLIEEVADFVDDQKNIACNNCKGKKFKDMKEPWQVM